MTFTVKLLHQKLWTNLLVRHLINTRNKFRTDFTKSLFGYLDVKILQEKFSQPNVDRVDIAVFLKSKLNQRDRCHGVPIFRRRYDVHVAKLFIAAKIDDSTRRSALRFNGHQPLSSWRINPKCNVAVRVD